MLEKIIVMKFLKMMLASALGYILAISVIFFLVFTLIAGIVFTTSKPKVVIHDNSVLKIELNYPLEDRVNDEGPIAMLSALDENTPIPAGLNMVLRSLERAKTDDRIKGVVLDLTSLSTGYGKLMEVRNKLAEFKETGKFIYTYSNVYDYQMYYLASVSDSVFLNPQGQMLFNGMRAEVVMFSSLLDKLGVEMQVVRNGKYKGAVEPFTRKELSDENRQQISELIHSIYNTTLAQIAASRNMNIEDLKKDASSLNLVSVQDFISKGYIDAALYRDELNSILKKRVGVSEDEKVYLLGLRKYDHNSKDYHYASKKVAVVYASGSIVVGHGDDSQIGSEDFVATLKKLREDDKIGAVVLRINSGGGSSLGSDIIWREAKLLADAKPLIVSMGDVAASGAYYIAAPAQTIIAEPTTITGSIGVFGMIPNAKGLLNDKLGLNIEYVGTGEHSDIGRVDRPLTQNERVYITKIVDGIYETFLQRVSEGRGMSISEVDEVGQGRVWSGQMAIDAGLVDELGGLEYAVQAAVKAADLTDYQLVEYPKFSDPFTSIVERFQGSSMLESQLSDSQFGRYLKYIIQAKEMTSGYSVQMLMPFDITVSSFGLR